MSNRPVFIQQHGARCSRGFSIPLRWSITLACSMLLIGKLFNIDMRHRGKIAVGLHLCPERLRSEEHTSELQSRGHLVCRLLLEEKNTCKTKERAEGCRRQVR